MRRLLLWPAICLFLVGLTLYIGRERLAHLPRPEFLDPHNGAKPAVSAAPSATTATIHPAPTAATTQGNGKLIHDFLSLLPHLTCYPDVLPLPTRTAYVDAIMNPDATALPRMECPKL